MPPADNLVRCEMHHTLVHAIRAGDRQATSQLRRHGRRATQETQQVQYGTVMDDGTCIIDTVNPIIYQGDGAFQGGAMLFYKRCNGTYKNAYGTEISRN